MNTQGFNSQAVRTLQNSDFWLHAALLFLGSFLVLFGLTQSWPCLPGSWFEGECSPALHSLVFSEFQVAIYLTLFALLMLISAKSNLTPFNYLAWGCFWLIYYIMIYIRWVPDDMGGAFPTAHFTAFIINTGLPGITPTVLPLGLVAVWLAVRPEALRWKTRWLAIAVLTLLLGFTLFFFAFEGVRIYTRSQIPNDSLDVFAFGGQGVFGLAPILILSGGLALLGEEILAIRKARSHAAPQSTPAVPPVSFSRAQKVHLAGFWAAIILAVGPLITLLGYRLAGNYDPVLFFLFSVLGIVLSILQVIAFLVLMLALLQAAPSGKKTVLKIGFGLALLYAGLTLLVAIAPQLTSAVNFKIAQSLHMEDHGFLKTSFINGLIGLALLFTLPLYQKSGFQRAIPWLLAINALLIIPTLVFMDFSRHLQSIAMLASAFQELILLPAVYILLAIYFRRSAKPSVTVT